MPPRVPYKRLIVADLIGQIDARTLKPGDKLPTQLELAARHGCSPGPVKAAIEELKLRGYVETHQGKATYVTEKPPKRTRT